TTALVDAFLPQATLAHSTNPLLRSLVDEATAVGRESAATPGTLEVDARHRVIGPDGAAHDNLWALGPWTSEMPLGAFARPRTDAPCHRRNDAVARELLLAAQSTAPASHARSALHAGPAPHARPTASTDRSQHTPRLGVLGPGKIGSALAAPHCAAASRCRLRAVRRPVRSPRGCRAPAPSALRSSQRAATSWPSRCRCTWRSPSIRHRCGT